MVTYCSVTLLQSANKPPTQAGSAALSLAKPYERRKCNHHKPKETDAECISGIMGTSENKFRLCVATQDKGLRATLRKVPGVPLLFEKRAMLLLEPPSTATVDRRREVRPHLLDEPDLAFALAQARLMYVLTLVRQIEESKLHIPSAELATLRPNAKEPSTSSGEQAMGTDSAAQPTPTAAGPSGTEASASLAPATRSTAASTPNTVDAVLERSNKRKRAKEPNPLSMKKKKQKTEADASGNAQGKGKGKGKGKAEANAVEGAKENRRPVAGLPPSKPAAHGVTSDQGAEQQPAVPQGKGVTMPEGPGTSKKALKRKAKKAAAAKAEQPAAETSDTAMAEATPAS